MADLQSVGFQLAIGCAVLFVTKLLWELCFSPLSAFPGPIVAKFTNIWRAIAASRGDVDTTNIELHRKYGSAVRIGPNCISLSDPKMIRAVYKGAWKKVNFLVRTFPFLSQANLAWDGKPTLINLADK